MELIFIAPDSRAQTVGLLSKCATQWFRSRDGQALAYWQTAHMCFCLTRVTVKGILCRRQSLPEACCLNAYSAFQVSESYYNTIRYSIDSLDFSQPSIII